MHKVARAMLLTDIPSFAERYASLARQNNVSLSVEKEWKVIYRVSSEVIICGSKYLDKINRAYYSMVVLILKASETPEDFISLGITRFIFDFMSDKELAFAFYVNDKILLHTTDKDLETLLKDSSTTWFCLGDYDFKFDKNIFKYKGKPLYFAESQKRYLAEWLLHGHKDNAKRMVLCNLRKKFGSDFLSNIDRFGRIKEKKNAQ